MPRESMRVEGLEGVLQTLKQLPAEIVSQRGGPVRSALRKAAVLIQRQAQANVQAIIDQPNDGDLSPESTGLLKANIVAGRIRPMQGQRGEAFLVRVRRKVYPGEGKWKKRTTAQIGTLLEEGTAKRAAMPWMRPAFEAKKAEAVGVFARELPLDIERAVKRVARKNRARL